MDAKEIKDRIKWYHEEAANKGNLAVVDEFLAPNYSGLDMLTGQKYGRQEMKQILAQSLDQMKAMYSEAHFTIEDILVEGNRAAFRWVATGTDHQGKVGSQVGFTMYTFVDGKVVEDYFIGGEVKTG